jgi:hypothetical protein
VDIGVRAVTAMVPRLGLQRRGLVGLFVAGVLVSGCAGNAVAAPPSGNGGQGGPQDQVAANPAVQQWFKRHEAQRIAVSDALQQAYVQLDTGAGNGCAQLGNAAAAMLATLPTPKHALDTQVVAGVEQFRAGALQCSAGDLAGAGQTIAAGAEARATAEAEIEELLESSNAGVN